MNVKDNDCILVRMMSFKVIRWLFIITLLLFNTSFLYAVSLTNTVPAVTLTDIKLGNTYNLAELIGLGFTYNYTGYDTDVVDCTVLNSGFTPSSGYELLPDKSGITIDPSSFTINNGSSTTVSVRINIPVKHDYLGKKYQFIVSGQTTTGSGRVGVNSWMNVEISSIFIGYGIAGYDLLSTIGLIGNKAKITFNVDSLEATILKLSYRITGTIDWTEINPLNSNPAANSDGTKDFGFEIPANEITPAGLEYCLQSVSGTTYAFSPEQTKIEFDGNGRKYFTISISRVTHGSISASSSSTVSVPDGNPDDGNVKITAGRGVVSQDTNIVLVQLDENGTDVPIAPSFSLSEKAAIVYSLRQESTKLLKSVDWSLLYFDNDNDGKIDVLVDKNTDEAIDASKLKMFYWDGFKWRMVIGTQTLNTNDHTVTAKINRFGVYALFPVNTLKPEDYRPAKKIITPNGDGKNDEVDFNGLPEEIKVFDIKGMKIRTIEAGVALWDGKDDDGTVVESGVYIYQYKVDGTLVSGVIAVAK